MVYLFYGWSECYPFFGSTATVCFILFVFFTLFVVLKYGDLRSGAPRRILSYPDDIRSTRMRIGCQYGDTTAGNILKGMGSYWVEGGTGDGGSLGPKQEGGRGLD